LIILRSYPLLLLVVVFVRDELSKILCQKNFPQSPKVF
jgi:hypothetical protein